MTAQPTPSSGQSTASSRSGFSQCGQSTVRMCRSSAWRAISAVNSKPRPSLLSRRKSLGQSCSSVSPSSTRPRQVSPPRKRRVTPPPAAGRLRGSSRTATPEARARTDALASSLA